MPTPLPQIHAALTGRGAPFEIAETEIRGVRTKTWQHAPESPGVALEKSRVHAEKTFLVSEERLSFKVCFQRVSRLARLC